LRFNGRALRLGCRAQWLHGRALRLDARGWLLHGRTLLLWLHHRTLLLLWLHDRTLLLLRLHDRTLLLLRLHDRTLLLRLLSALPLLRVRTLNLLRDLKWLRLLCRGANRVQWQQHNRSNQDESTSHHHLAGFGINSAASARRISTHVPSGAAERGHQIIAAFA
jgi:hypothetical protein